MGRVFEFGGDVLFVDFQYSIVEGNVWNVRFSAD